MYNTLQCVSLLSSLHALLTLFFCERVFGYDAKAFVFLPLKEEFNIQGSIYYRIICKLTTAALSS